MAGRLPTSVTRRRVLVLMVSAMMLGGLALSGGAMASTGDTDTSGSGTVGPSLAEADTDGSGTTGPILAEPGTSGSGTIGPQSTAPLDWATVTPSDNSDGGWFLSLTLDDYLSGDDLAEPSGAGTVGP